GRKKFYYSLSKKAARLANRVVTISSRSEKDLVQRWHLNPAKISVVYPGVNDAFRHEPSPERTHAALEHYQLQSGYIYAGGGLETRKNFDGLLRAYHMLQKMHHDGVLKVELPPLVISGKLMPELAPLVTDVAALVQQLHLTHSVRLLGFVPAEDLPILYRQARVFVYPSKYEGFGLPILEAMASGAPVASARTSSLPEVGGDAVQYFDPNHDQEIADAIEKLLTDHQTREMLRHRGLERAQQFSWERFSRSVLDSTLALISRKS
ncbi:glycosyltransferase family 1 protein, partial [Patescibacteria group bacterium]